MASRTQHVKAYKFASQATSVLAKHATHIPALQCKSWQVMSTTDRLWHDCDHAPNYTWSAPATRAVEESTECCVWPAGEV